MKGKHLFLGVAAAIVVFIVVGLAGYYLLPSRLSYEETEAQYKALIGRLYTETMKLQYAARTKNLLSLTSTAAEVKNNLEDIKKDTESLQKVADPAFQESLSHFNKALEYYIKACEEIMKYNPNVAYGLIKFGTDEINKAAETMPKK